MDSQKRKKKSWERFVKGTRGAISIFLCLLLTPFLSISLGLVEYARYQSLIEITDEIMEITGLSALADYDTYLHKRFGLLALSQEEGNALSGGDQLLTENAGIMGSQITVANVGLSGVLSLENNEVLKQQVIDVSELTGTTAVLLKDFQLEELLQKLQVTEQFQAIINTVESVAKLTEELKKAVEAGESFKTAIQETITGLSNARAYAQDLATKLTDLYQKLAQNGVRLPESATAEQITAVLESFAADYLEDLKSIYGTARNLISEIDGLKDKLDTLKTSANKFVQAVRAAREAVSGIGDSGTENGNKVTENAVSTLADVLGTMEDLVDDTVDQIKEETIATAKNTLNEILNTSLESFGLADAVARYSSIANGEYFQVPLSDMAKEDLTQILEQVPAVWEDGDYTILLEALRQRFLPTINIDLAGLSSSLSEVLERAAETLENGIGNKLVDLLTKLVNIVKNLFDLDVFYEADLNAYVNVVSGDDSESPYQSFLNAVGKIFTAIEDFTDSVTGLDIIGILTSTTDLLKAVGSLLKSIMGIASASITSIGQLLGYVTSGNFQSLYEKLLIAGYMRHNLPSRLSSGPVSGSYDSGQASFKIDLLGAGLTGFNYNEIARPSTYIGGSDNGNNGFSNLGHMIRNLQKGHGSDTMFKGAELEYIRAGTNSEIANQVIVFFDLYFLRLLLDIVPVFMDSEVASLAASATVASWAVYLLYLVVEPFLDVLLLVNNTAVPIVRTDCYLSASGIDDFVTKMGNAVMSEELRNSLKEFGDGTTDDDSSGDDGGLESDGAELGYDTYLLLLILIHVKDSDIIDRFADIVKLEAAEYYGEGYSLGEAYTAVEVTADVTFYPFFDLGEFNGGSSLIPAVDMRQTISY